MFVQLDLLLPAFVGSSTPRVPFMFLIVRNGIGPPQLSNHCQAFGACPAWFVGRVLGDRLSSWWRQELTTAVTALAVAVFRRVERARGRYTRTDACGIRQVLRGRSCSSLMGLRRPCGGKVGRILPRVWLWDRRSFKQIAGIAGFGS